MSMLRARRVVFSWIALAAILMLTCAPSASRMLTSEGAFAWSQVCSAGADASTRATSKPASPTNPAGGHMLEHCPYCALHADLALPPAPRVTDAGLSIALRGQPRAFLEAPRAGAVWATAQPRAPPVAA